MNTGHQLQPDQGDLISLNSSETAHLKRSKSENHLEITVIKGVIRIGAEQSKITQTTSNLTLAFACRTETCRFSYPENLDIKIEAISDTSYFVKRTNQKISKGDDTIMDWVLQLHFIRHERNVETRLMRLFQLLTTRLGKRTPRGLLLEHTLSHARIAEIVGSTRSTISRTISKLRKSERIYIDELKNQLILPAE